MDMNKYNPILHSDIGIYTEELYKQHKALLDNEQYQDAGDLLAEHLELAAPSATLLNEWENKIVDLEQDFNKDQQRRKESTEFIGKMLVRGASEPSGEQFSHTIIWTKPL